MKKLLILLFPFFAYAQTPITDSNFQVAINTCLSTNPDDGMCSDSEYGAMPDWDVSQVTNMNQAFYDKADFNADINNWDVSNVTNMGGMFYLTSFNEDISDWDVTNVTIMGGMFDSATAFNQNISAWDVSNVASMGGMFQYAYSFNQDISEWDVSSATAMEYMFYNATVFNQNISGWCAPYYSSEPTDFSTGSDLSDAYQPVWGACESFGLDDQNQSDISIYPNPVIDKLFIQGLSNPTKISVYNVLGKLVLSKTTSSEINVDNLQSGIYIIKIVDEQKEIVKKFIKN